MTRTPGKKAPSEKPNPALPRQKGQRQEPKTRTKNFEPVAQGLTLEQAKLEASRCLACKKAKCTKACPVNIDITAFIRHIRKGDMGAAASTLLEANLLPAICGRVCPQETYCEKACVIAKKFSPVAIGMLERFAADHARDSGMLKTPLCAAKTGFKVAAVGSGPSSLTVAAELKRLGHDVTVFEALHELGGVLVYGIPSFRLPRTVVRAEIETVKNMGVKFETDVLVGRTVTVDELLKDYDAVYIGSGAGLPSMMKIPGENLVGVYSSNEFLTRINLMRAREFPNTDTPFFVGKNVLVVGGGNAAMDAARCSMRLGPEKVTVVYRRSRVEMPARAEEVENAMEEGVRFEFLSAPVELEGNSEGRLVRAKCIRMELGEPDASGRRRPIPIKGSEYYIEADSMMFAIGQSPNPIIQKTTEGLAVLKWGTIEVDERGKTSRDNIFAGGDVTRGGATVLLAMKDGKTAAAAIHEYLMKKRVEGSR